MNKQLYDALHASIKEAQITPEIAAQLGLVVQDNTYVLGDADFTNVQASGLLLLIFEEI